MISPRRRSVDICDYCIVIPPGSFAVMSFEIMTREKNLVTCFAKCILVPDSTISSLFLLGEFGGVSIHFIKLILGLLI